jgi:hypothetical protein
LFYAGTVPPHPSAPRNPAPQKDKAPLTLSLDALRSVPPELPLLYAGISLLLTGAAAAYFGRGAHLNFTGPIQISTGIALWLMLLSGPAAIALATICAISLGWMPHISPHRAVSGLAILICVSPVLAVLTIPVLFLEKAAPLIGIFLAMLSAAGSFCLLLVVRAIMMDRWSSLRADAGPVFRAGLVSAPVGLVLGALLHPVSATFSSLSGPAICGAAVFSLLLALPAGARPSSLASAQPVSPQPAPPPAASPRPASQSARPQPPLARTPTIDRIALLLGAQIAVSAITQFQRASRAVVPVDSNTTFIPFLLAQLPFLILIWLLLKQPGQRAFTFLTAALAAEIVETLINPRSQLSYRQIYDGHSIGLMWPALAALIYLATGALAYTAIKQSRIKLKPASVVLGAFGLIIYFLLMRQFTPDLYVAANR